MSKQFPTADVLGAVTGVLLSRIDGIYKVCNYATGESVFTHQLPRVSEELRAAMLIYRPDLQRAVDESAHINGGNYLEWLSTWTRRYGENIEVRPLTNGQHERIDPISELAEKVHPSKIILV